MRKYTAFFLSLLVLHYAAPIHGDDNEMKNIPEQTDELYRTGSGAQDGMFSSVSLSMLGWGLGLAAGIAIIASVLHQSTSSSNHDTCSHD